MEKKMKFDLKYLLEEGLLRKIPSSKQKADESINSAKSWIKESENNLNNKSLMSCMLTGYLAMFHAARAILFLDGFREKSHFAVARYLESEYAAKNKLEMRWIRMLDYCRELRHDDQYSTSFIVTEDDAKNSLESAKSFVERIEKLYRVLAS